MFILGILWIRIWDSEQFIWENDTLRVDAINIIMKGK